MVDCFFGGVFVVSACGELPADSHGEFLCVEGFYFAGFNGAADDFFGVFDCLGEVFVVGAHFGEYVFGGGGVDSEFFGEGVFHFFG